MPVTYKKITSATVGAGGVASVTLSSIPSTYTDLIVLASARSTRAGSVDDLVVQINGSASSNTYRRLFGSGSGTASDTGTDLRGFAVANGSTASVFSNNVFYIPNYNATQNRSVSIDAVNENNATESYSGLIAGLHSNTTAVTSLKFLANNGDLMQYSTFTLYGISKS